MDERQRWFERQRRRVSSTSSDEDTLRSPRAHPRRTSTPDPERQAVAQDFANQVFGLGNLFDGGDHPMNPAPPVVPHNQPQVVPQHQPQVPPAQVQPEPVMANQAPDLNAMLMAMTQAVNQNATTITLLQTEVGNIGARIQQVANAVEGFTREANERDRNRPARVIKIPPKTFPEIDLDNLDNENRLKIESFISWQDNVYQRINANPDFAHLPIARLSAGILADMGQKTRTWLMALGPNPVFADLPDLMNRLKVIFCPAAQEVDAKLQFEKSVQENHEDVNAWCARLLNLFYLAYGVENQFWELLINQLFKGLKDKKIAKKVLSEKVVIYRPADWAAGNAMGIQALADQAGFLQCKNWLIEEKAGQSRVAAILGEGTRFQNQNAGGGNANRGTPMDTNALQRGGRQGRNQNQGQSGARPKGGYVNQTSGKPPNPPAGSAKRLNNQFKNSVAQNKGGKNTANNANSGNSGNSGNSAKKDRSQDKCKACGRLGHWARDCPKGKQVNNVESSPNDYEDAATSGSAAMAVVHAPEPTWLPQSLHSMAVEFVERECEYEPSVDMNEVPMKPFIRSTFHPRDVELINSCEGPYDWKKQVLGRGFNRIASPRKTPVYRNCSDRTDVGHQDPYNESVIGYNCTEEYCERRIHLDRAQAPTPLGLQPTRSRRKNKKRNLRVKVAKETQDVAPNLCSVEEFPELHECCLCHQSSIPKN